MKKLLALLFLAPAGLLADTAEVAYFKAVLSPRNEVPAITDLNASGSGLVRASVVRNSAGRIVSGSVDFLTNYSFPGAVTIVGMHIHNGAAGVNGPVRIDSGITAGQPVQDPTGVTNSASFLQRQGQTKSDNPMGLETLEGIFRDPSQFYLNVHTTTHTGGAIRGQLKRAQHRVLIGNMLTSNEVPAVTNINASAISQVQVFVTRDATDTIDNASVLFDLDYTFPAQETFQGLHIHTGPAGVNGGVQIDTGLGAGARSIQSTESGVGNLRRLVEMTTFTQGQLVVLEGLFLNPANFYINLHTPANPGGAIRSQLRPTDETVFTVSMSPANEIPAITDLAASGESVVHVNSIRNDSGDITAAVVTFNVNHRFPGATEFVGLHIHDGLITANGPVRVDSGLSQTASIASADGFGNIFVTRLFTSATSLATLNSLMKNPENHYLNLHTRVNPGGAIRAQMRAPDTTTPQIVDIISGVSDPTLRTGGNGGLVTVFGRNLFKVPGDLGGFASPSAPIALNGTDVSIGGSAAPIVMLGRDPLGNPSDYIVVQVPFETAAGPQPVVVRNSNGAGAPFNITVAASSPGIFFDSEGGIVFRVLGLSLTEVALIRRNFPARANDTLAIVVTGAGNTSPALVTGAFTPGDREYTVSGVTVTIGGRTVTPLTTAAVPGFIGLQIVVFTMPSGITGTTTTIEVTTTGGARSNRVTIPIA